MSFTGLLMLHKATYVRMSHMGDIFVTDKSALCFLLYVTDSMHKLNSNMS